MSSSLLLVLAAGFLPFHHDPRITTSRYEIPAWRISVSKDRFTSARHCRLYQGSPTHPAVRYYHGVVAFQFARKLDTTTATFKLDDGTPRSWTEVYPALVQGGVNLEGRSLDNPTGGSVLIPLSDLRTTSTVTIRPVPRARPKRFTIAGLGDALASAHGLGCDAEAGFDL